MTQISVRPNLTRISVRQAETNQVSVRAVGPQGPQGDAGPPGSSTFIGLTDTPGAFGAAGFLVGINPTTDALIFIDPASVGTTTFTGLTDTPGAIPDGEYLVGSGGSLVFTSSIPASDVSGLATVATTGNYSDLIGLPSLVTSFLDLTDTPGAFGTPGQFAVVNGAGDAIEFVDSPATPPGGDVNQVQYHAAGGVFGGVSAMDFDGSVLTLLPDGPGQILTEGGPSIVSPFIGLVGNTDTGIVLSDQGGLVGVGFVIDGGIVFQAIQSGPAIISAFQGFSLSTNSITSSLILTVNGTGNGVVVTDASGVELRHRDGETISIVAALNDPRLRWAADTLGGGVSLVGPNIATEIEFTLPAALPASNREVIVADTSGVMTTEARSVTRSVGASFAVASGDIPAGTEFVVRVPDDLSGDIVRITILADGVGSVTFDLARSTFAGYPGSLANLNPSAFGLSSSQKNEITSFAGWTTAIVGGDVLRFDVASQSSGAISSVSVVVEVQE